VPSSKETWLTCTPISNRHAHESRARVDDNLESDSSTASTMRVLLTGAGGFIGQITAKALLNDPKVTELILTDVVEPSVPRDAKYRDRATVVKADLLDAADDLVARKPDVVLLLHGIMSSGAEADFELGYRVNVDATRTLLFAVARAQPGVRVIYASSIAVYGSPCPKRGLTEETPTTPESSYGCQKIICETYINDLTRKGKIDGLVLRFPGITVRPGKPAAAASSFMSGIIREPMDGKECVVPTTNRTWRMWVSSPGTLVKNILIATRLDTSSLARHRRVVLLPGFATTIDGMLDALAKVGGKEKLALVKLEEDASLKPLFDSWPEEYDNSFGLSLGFKQDDSFVTVVQEYVDGLKQTNGTAH
jgi:nucleoside-diphosphate-sugar epimerase